MLKIILIIVVLLLVIFFTFNPYREEKWIRQNPVCTTALITYNLAREKYGKKKINYFYRVNGEAVYREFVPTAGEKAGDTICIVYSFDHPKVSRRVTEPEMEDLCNCK